MAGRGIIASDAGDAWAPAKPCPDDTPIRALARVHRWRRMLDDGKYRSAGDIAEPEGVTRSFVYGLLRLTLLAPDIVEAILEGMPPNGYGAGGVDTAKSKMLENIPTGPHMLFIR